MSDFHPETWNPLWSVSTILMGLYSFMLEDTPTQGSIVTSMEQKRKLALESLSYNIQDSTFCELFPDLVNAYKIQQQQLQEASKNQLNNNDKKNEEGIINGIHGGNGGEDFLASWGQIAGLVGVLGVMVFIMMKIASL
jgi:ubiquitin-conjugating enzyme E2 J2